MNAVPDGLSVLAAGIRADADVFAKWGFDGQAEHMRRLAIAVLREAELTHQRWISEATAIRRSGRSVDYFRARFPALAAEGLARRGSGREYREVVAICAKREQARLPSIVFEEARRGRR
jgi:hypothetical protein